MYLSYKYTIHSMYCIFIRLHTLSATELFKLIFSIEKEIKLMHNKMSTVEIDKLNKQILLRI